MKIKVQYVRRLDGLDYSILAENDSGTMLIALCLREPIAEAVASALRADRLFVEAELPRLMANPRSMRI